MTGILQHLTEKKFYSFLKNVCSTRTNLGLLHYRRDPNLCNRGIEPYD